jgi:hypothetical protein
VSRNVPFRFHCGIGSVMRRMEARGKRTRMNKHNRISHDYILKGWKKMYPGNFLRSLYFFPDGHANVLPIEKLMI